MSGWHIVAVTVNGSEVRHSPVLELHDGKEVRDGTLLLMHLLNPTFTRSKAPWFNPPSPQGCDTSICPKLPYDILRQIMHFTTFNTYNRRLPWVSKYFRSIFLTYPRIGHHTLLGYGGVDQDLEPIFKICSTSSTNTELAQLKRLKASIPDYGKGSAIRRYPLKHYHGRPVLKRKQAGVFQYHQIGTKPLEPAPLATKGVNTPIPITLKPIKFEGITSRGEHPPMRVQVLDGVWRMMVVTGNETGGNVAPSEE